MRSHAKGFTLLELLVVVAIIVVLMALLGGVGIAVIHHQKSTNTKNLTVALDRALDEYMQQNGNTPPKYRLEDYREMPGPRAMGGNYFRADSAGVEYPIRPDASVFIKQAIGVGEVAAIIGGLGERFLKITRTRTGDFAQGATVVQSSTPALDADVTPTVVDVWADEGWEAPWDLANPAGQTVQQAIYYVHPDNLLAQDLYGRCVNGRPYFFSAGPDLRYGLSKELPAGAVQKEVEASLADNVYSYPVGPANLTAGFFGGYR